MRRGRPIDIYARHGARLDAEDNDWLANSSTPYDPPLSYGGWTQTRALGGRIASLLHEREVALNKEAGGIRRRGSEDIGAKDSNNGHDQSSITTPARRKHRVIIHSSPFLRCVQSSIALSAGMAQYQGNLARIEANSRLSSGAKFGRFMTPNRSQTLDSASFESNYGTGPASQKVETSLEKQGSPEAAEVLKPTLRIDACLGEWLSPDYFEFITAPPSSNMMVAGAKADLLRRATPLQGSRPAEDPASDPPPLVLDERNVTESIDRLSLSEQPGASSSLQKSTNGSLNTEAMTKNAGNRFPASRQKSVAKGYVPPTPGYAIAGTESIPPGYAAHARDACVELDFQWDSMRHPQEWGDGGEHGEEWSSMHKRFRKALMSMITWYKNSGPSYDPQAEPKDVITDEEMDDNEDIVLVIVTHGAGCNALIGALTNQPVLMDVGMASLTMAVHKGSSYSSEAPLRRVSSSRRGSVDISQSEEYNMRLTASMDHLRAGGDPLKIPQLQSPRVLASIPETSKRSSASTSGVYSPPPEPERSRNSALGSVRRSRATTAGGVRKSSNEYVSHSPLQTGLWGSRQPSTNGAEMTALAELSEVSHEDPSAANLLGSPMLSPSTAANVQPIRATSRGLWGSEPRKPPARRWTVVEQN